MIDYQNIHLTAHDNFGDEKVGKHVTLISPASFAANLIARRNASQREGYPLADLSLVEVYRGQPSAEREPERYAITQRERSRWTRDSRVDVRYRPLKYYVRNGQVVDVQEKGVDVLCALALVRLAAQSHLDLVILATHDSDLEPALDMAAGMGAAKVETAGWARGARNTRRIRCEAASLWHTFLTKEDFERSVDPDRYSDVFVPRVSDRGSADSLSPVVYSSRSGPRSGQ